MGHNSRVTTRAGVWPSTLETPPVLADAMWSASLLPRDFFGRPATEVARALLGQVVVHRVGDEILAARIVETEAYLDERDLASHARFGRTQRNAAMFGPPGFAYVYFVYGLHTMLNVVTGADGGAEAVLLRAAEPVAGITARLDGPGRLSRGLRIERAHDGTDLCALPGVLGIVAGPAPETIAVGRRVGVDYAGSWRDAPLRFRECPKTPLCPVETG